MSATVVVSSRGRDLVAAAAPRIAALAAHPVWSTLDDRAGLVRFMESHVYCVWDFMSLLEALRRLTTGRAVPWRPVGDPQVRRLVNEIVLAEESDRLPDGRVASHFELYLAAMDDAGASVATLRRFLDAVSDRAGPGRLAADVRRAAAEAGVPRAAAEFMETTFAVIDRGRPAEIAAAFGIGREQAIPDMFAATLAAVGRDAGCGLFAEYLDRHVALDGEEHGPMMLDLLDRVCGTDATEWAAARSAAIEALDARRRLWDSLVPGSSR